MYEKQRKAIFEPVDAFGKPARYGLVEASTKTGKTVGCILWLFELAWLGPVGANYWWVAPVFGQTNIAYRRMIAAIPPEYVISKHVGASITIIGDRTIWFKSADNPDTLFGEDVHGAVIDEASRVKKEAFYAIRSTLTATRGPIRCIGNVRGRKNWFFDLCRRAEKGEPNLGYTKLVAYDAVEAGVLTSEDVEDARAVLPEDVFRELYLAEPSDDGGNPFGLTHIEACIIEKLSGRKPICWGWDLAKSVDWTVGIALDEIGEPCRFVRFQKVPWPETIQTIRRETGRIAALVDSTGLGDPIVEDLQRKAEVVPLRRAESEDGLQKLGGSNFRGFKFNPQSKQQLMEGLAVAIQNKKTRILDGVWRMEMESFEYEFTRTGVRYSAPPGHHDDCVCAHALAVMCREHAKRPMQISDEMLGRAAAAN